MGEVFKFLQAYRGQGGDAEQLADEVSAVLSQPSRFVDDPLRSGFARSLLQPDLYRSGKPAAPWRQWGAEIDAAAQLQLELACMSATEQNQIFCRSKTRQLLRG
jgi:tRNA-splicing ligase RtcB